MKKRILVTGSQGYIGSVLIPKIIEEGHTVLNYDTGFFRESLLYDFKELNHIQVDMRQFDYNLLEDVDVVIHLASIANDPFGNLDYKKIYSPITNYSLRLAEECKKRNIRFIWPSSCSVYGIGKGLQDEESMLNPQTPYSQNKAEFEKELEKLCDKDFTPVVLRLCTLYGLSPRIRFDLVINMFAGMAHTLGKITLNSDGQSWRPLVHIDDVCSAMIQCIGDDLLIEKHQNKNKPLILNIGSSNENYKIIDLANIAANIVEGCSVSFLDYARVDSEGSDFTDQNIKEGVDVRTYKVSFEKVKTFLPKFKANFDVKRGIFQMIDKFSKINLDYKEFTHYKYYRLKTMDFLLKNNKINDDLEWIK